MSTAYTIASLATVSQALAQRTNIDVTLGQGEEAYCQRKDNGRYTINIPLLNDSENALTLARGYIDHETGHVLHTDFNVLKSIRNNRIHFLSNAYEDSRIETLLGKTFTGCKRNLQELNTLLLKDFTIDNNNSENVYNWILLKSLQYNNTQLTDTINAIEQSVNTIYPNLIPLLQPIIDEVPCLQSTQDTVNLAEKTLNIITKYCNDKQSNQQSKQSQGQQEQGQGQQSQNGQGQNSQGQEQGQQNSQGQDAQDGQEQDSQCQQGQADSQGQQDGQDNAGNGQDGQDNADAQDGQDTQDGCNSRHSGRKGTGKSRQNASKGNTGINGNTGNNISQQDIANLLQGTMDAPCDKDAPCDNVKEQLCNNMIHDNKAQGHTSMRYMGNIENHTYLGKNACSNLSFEQITECKTAISQLKARFTTALQSIARSKYNTSYRGKIDRKHISSINTTSKVFSKRVDGKTIDTEVMLLGDISGSMNDYGNITLMSQAIYSVMTTLRTMRNIRSSTYLFSHDIYELFLPDSKITSHCSLVGSGNTELGYALLQCLMRFNAKYSRKILIFLTDGYPDDEKSVQDAILAAKQLGIELYGIGMQTTALDEYKTLDHANIKSLRELAPSLLKILTKKLASLAA